MIFIALFIMFLLLYVFFEIKDRVNRGSILRESSSDWKFLSLASSKDNTIKFEQLGISNPFLVNNYIQCKVIFAIAISSLLVLLGDVDLIAIVVVFPVLIVGPDVYINISIKRINEKNVRNFPYLIEMISMSLRNGMTVEQSIHYVTNEVSRFDRDLYRFSFDLNQAVKTKGINIGLTEFEKKHNTPAISTFSSLVIQGVELGATISPMLDDLAKDIRDDYLFKLEEKIGKLSAKMSVPLILLIMFPLVILILAPGVIRILSGTFSNFVN